MSITVVFTIEPFVPCSPLQNLKYASDVNMGALKMQDRKMQDLKMQDQIAGHENAGPENEGPNRRA